MVHSEYSAVHVVQVKPAVVDVMTCVNWREGGREREREYSSFLSSVCPPSLLGADVSGAISTEDPLSSP